MGIGLGCQFMIDGKKIISIIPARAGSKRIPGKNKLLFQGQPLIEWTIKSSILCSKIDQTILSTDDDEISNIGQKYNLSMQRVQ